MLYRHPKPHVRKVEKTSGLLNFEAVIAAKPKYFVLILCYNGYVIRIQRQLHYEMRITEYRVDR